MKNISRREIEKGELTPSHGANDAGDTFYQSVKQRIQQLPFLKQEFCLAVNLLSVKMFLLHLKDSYSFVFHSL